MNKEPFDPLADFETTTRSYIDHTKPAIQAPREKVVDIPTPKPQVRTKQVVKNPTPPAAKKETPKPVEAPQVTMVNVTTRLPLEQRTMLKQAAAWNKAFGKEPQTEQGIFQQAVADYMSKNGFPKSSKS